MRRLTRTHWKPALILVFSLAIASCAPFKPTQTGPILNTLAPSTPEPVGTPTTANQFRPSPAGWIAFVHNGNIWLVHPDGSTPKQVTKIDPPATDLKMAWSSDGQVLAYWTAGKLYALDISGLEITQLAAESAGGFDWSETAHQLIYDTPLSTSSTPTNNGLWVISVTDGKMRQIGASTIDHPAMLSPLWSFDSSSVIFSTPAVAGQEAGLTLLDAAANTLTPLPRGTCSWSPLELLIACVHDAAPEGQAASVTLLNRNGVENQRVALPEAHFHAQLGPWSTDGGSIAIIYSPDAAGTQVMTDVLSLETSEFKPLGAGRAASWSPDGRWITVEASSGADAAGTLQVINTTSGLSSTLAEGTLPLWQPAAGLDVTLATAAPVDQAFCMDARIGYVHEKPKGHYLMFCIGDKKYNYGALASGVYLVGPETRYFVYVSNTGFVYAARMGDPALTRIGNVRWFRAIQYSESIDPNFQIRTIAGYPYLIQVYELKFNQKATLTLPKHIYLP